MKSSIIYEKKKITIGEFINIYNINLIWFCILGINLISNHYLDIHIRITIDSNLYANETNYSKQLELLSDKLFFSKKLISVGLFINIFLMFTYKKISKFISNKFISNDIISIIPICFFMLSTLLYKPLLIYFIFNHSEYELDLDHSCLIIIITVFYYTLVELLVLAFVLILVLLSLMILFENIYKICNDFYKKNIKNITFEYTETKFIDLEKNI